jgi:Kef-type K+ transport system membrane component KefB
MGCDTSPTFPEIMRKTLKSVLAEYGPVAVVVYLVIFAAVLLGSWAAIHMGWRPASAAGSVGTFTAAYLFTKVTQPLRIAATLALTPLVARLTGRGRPS